MRLKRSCTVLMSMRPSNAPASCTTGFGSTPAAAPQTPSKPAAPQPAATYTAAPAAEPLIPISPTSSLTAAPPTPAPAPSPPAPRYPSIPSSATPYPNQSAAPSPSLSSAPAHAAAPTSRSGSSALQPTPRATSPPADAPTASAPRSPPPPPYSQHAEHADYTHPQSSASLTSYGSAMSSQHDTHAQARTHGGIPQSYGADSNGGYGQGHASAGTGDGMYSAAAPSLHGGSGASVTSAIGGYLKVGAVRGVVCLCWLAVPFKIKRTQVLRPGYGTLISMRWVSWGCWHAQEGREVHCAATRTRTPDGGGPPPLTQPRC